MAATMPSPTAPPPRPILVLGAGIIGLTTALRLLHSPLCTTYGYTVHILADHWPTDGHAAGYASLAAGAHHLSFADDADSRQRGWDWKTFETMYAEWEKAGETTGLMRIKQTEYMSEGTHLKIYEQHPDFVVNDPTFLPAGIAHSVSFTSLTITPLTYLTHLLSLIRAHPNARLHRAHLPSLSSLSSPPILSLLGQPPALVVNCTGIGSASLGGVSDTQVHPVRGHVVLVRAPWVKEGFTRQIGSLKGAEGGERTYVIPRADGTVVLGGTRQVGDWNTAPMKEDREGVLKRALEICPELLRAGTGSDGKMVADSGEGEERGRDGSRNGNGHGWKRLEGIMVDEVVGLRPQRYGGIRLELGESVKLDDGKEVKVVHNYGHGGAGWQSCWGCAEDVVRLVQAELGTGPGSARAKL